MDAEGSSGITPEGQSRKEESRAPFPLGEYDADTSARPILCLETQPL